MYLGLDFGTSGARACVVDGTGKIVHQDQIQYVDATGQKAEVWREALNSLLRQLPGSVSTRLKGIAIDATSGTVLLCDTALKPLSPALLYHDTRAQAQAEELKNFAPAGHFACSASSGLAKFLWLSQHTQLDHAAHFMHQADWLAALLTGSGGFSDYHNALKTGYDAEQLCWPAWVLKLPHSHLLPNVFPPGQIIAEISPVLSQHFNINPACSIHAGTTDSIAAFIAADVNDPGSAVTSLGSTLVLKLLSTTRVESVQEGVYSHRYGNLWLAGGASNAGGNILNKYFTVAQLSELSKQIDASVDSPLDYYPLPHRGERFPHNDPDLEPRLSPRPADDVAFLHGLLQGLSRIEADGYARLVQLGATPLTSVTSSGGGANNVEWQQTRLKLLHVPVTKATHTEAAYGTAMLAMRAAII